MVISLLLLLISIAHSDVCFRKMKICVQGSSARPKWPLKPRNKNIASLKLCIPLAVLHYGSSLFAICTSPIKQNVNPQHFPLGLSSIFVKTTVIPRRNGTHGLFHLFIYLFIYLFTFIYFYLVFFFLYRGRGGGGRGAKKMYYGRSEMANWQYMYRWFTLAESSKSLIQGRTKPPCAFRGCFKSYQ